MIISLFFLIAGFFLLTYGADYLVRGGSALAVSAGIRPMVIGLTVVAFGTSMPEAVVTILGVIQGANDIALGNIVGSNIANIALVLGVAAVIRSLPLESGVLRAEIPMVIVASVAFWLMGLNGMITLVDGLILLAGFAGFLWFCFHNPQSVEEDEIVQQGALSKQKRWLFLVGGVLGLTIGAQVLVTGASDLARMAGVSEVVIGATVVAIGTSLPELVTSAVAAWKGKVEIGVGNVLGSNIFNLAIIGGVTLVQPVQVPSSVVAFDIPIMVGFALLLYPIARRKLDIGRGEGLILLAGYIWYVTFLFL
ncbi:calcium/sodium antiporter [Chrysiogenes arsenatis]|uniref:calcium/sodium antiporter n=1 Tax=Chrysiogenes arsenatis TaxID=309797 RepID=UPI00041D8880|nr:calcium/sodium antiporter [Chrysiogenes arsenatis]